MEITNYITDSRLIIIPVLYIIGYIIKQSTLIKNKYIPLTILLISITISVLMGGNTIMNNIIQGILVAGTTVMTNQIIKQSTKIE